MRYVANQTNATSRYSLRQRTCVIFLALCVAGCQTAPPATLRAPVGDALNCAELANWADALRSTLKALTAPREPTSADVGEFAGKLLAYLYFFPLLPLFIAGEVAEQQRPIDQNRAYLAEVEEAMRKKGCPTQVPATPTDMAPGRVPTQPEEAAP